MDIKFFMGAAELDVTHRHIAERLGGRMLPKAFWRALVAGVIIGMLWQARNDSYPRWFFGVMIVLAGALAARALADWHTRRHAQAAQQTAGDYAVTLSAQGIACRAPDGRVESHGWQEIAAIETAGGYLYFHLLRPEAIAVPLAAPMRPAGQAGDAAPDLAGVARGLWAAHPGNAGHTLPELPPIAETRGYQLGVNLRQAARMLFFFKFDPKSFRASWGALATLVLAEACWVAVTDYLQALPLPVFNMAGVWVYAISLALLLGWALAVSGLMAQRATLLRLLVMSESAMLLFNLLYVSFDMKLAQRLPDAENLRWGVFLFFLAWMVAVLVRIIRSLYGTAIFTALAMGGAYVLFSVTLSSLFPQGSIYLNAVLVRPSGAIAPQGGGPASAKPAGGKQPSVGAVTNVQDQDDGDDGDDGADDPGGDPGDDSGDDGADVADGGQAAFAKLDVEDIYYRQPEMVRHALERVQPRRAGETALYFVGFAGDASEHEFGNEVRYARGLLDRRFNTAGRSLLLINSYDSVTETPLANTHNMEAVLQGLAGRMDRNKDVLFLFLSSHGAQDHRLAVSFSPLEMNDLKAEKLKAMLDRSGIRNRVIVVSACYSGGFLDVLKDDNTLILTASRRDHVAYGCGDITQYTYFGEAYFVKALEHSNSFISAFDEARNRIAAREKSEGVDASGPQIHVGRNIGRVLEKLKVNPVGLHAKPAKDDVQRCPENCLGEPG